MESLIFGSRCESESTTCNFAMLGSLVRAMASRHLDDWFSSRMEGVENSITHCVTQFSSLLSEIREETVTAVLLHPSWDHAECTPWALADERYENEGIAGLDIYVLGYAGHLRTQAKKSGLNPELFPG